MDYVVNVTSTGFVIDLTRTGPQGATGPAGPSAYTAAVGAGYSGTESQFNALLATLGSSAGITTIAYSTTIPFTYAVADMGIKYISGATVFTANTSGATRNNSVMMTVVANGVNAPTFSGIVADGNSASYVNTSGVVNTLRMRYDGLKYYYSWSCDAGQTPVQIPATNVTLSGPTSGTTGVASTNFTVAANGIITGTIVVTPSSNGGGGTFSPTTVSISAGTPTATFTYTPASTGAKTISVTNNGGLANPSNLTYTSNTAVTVAGAPTIGTATAGDASATVSFTAPVSNGGATITSYTATSSPDGFTGTLSQASSGTITVSGLTNGTAYTFTVKANNSAGASAASAASNSVTPASVVDTRARFFIAPASAYNTSTQAFITGATVLTGSTNGSAAGSFDLTTTSGNYGWLAVLASAAPNGIHISAVSDGLGGWSGAGLTGSNTGASPDPTVVNSSFTDSSGRTWKLFRQDYINSSPTAKTFTVTAA